MGGGDPEGLWGGSASHWQRRLLAIGSNRNGFRCFIIRQLRGHEHHWYYCNTFFFITVKQHDWFNGGLNIHAAWRKCIYLQAYGIMHVNSLQSMLKCCPGSQSERLARFVRRGGGMEGFSPGIQYMNIIQILINTYYSIPMVGGKLIWNFFNSFISLKNGLL